MAEIRSSFLEVLLGAVAGGKPVGLDFVYGKVADERTLQPLDGQQRLTTLFLLHWYIASAADALKQGDPWTRFSYATRASAERFCHKLAAHPLPFPLPDHHAVPSDWITDQPWYLHTWRLDPSIDSMLVMVDAIHTERERLHPSLDTSEAWVRLTHPEKPAVSFYLLPLDDIESEDDLYIKMNSRGKPLTPFESFKATFEQDIERAERADDFAHRIDGEWTNLFWPYRGKDNLVDDRLLRYIDFITEICEAREDRVETGRLGPRARAVFGESNPRADEHLDFLFNAFDRWGPGAVARVFDDHFVTTAGEDHDPTKVVLFGRAAGGVDDSDATSTDLFEQCLFEFDSQRGRSRTFTLQQGLLLYAVLLHRIYGPNDFPRRLRVLRNLVTASVDEVRRDALPDLVRDVEAVILRGDLESVKGLSTNQVDDERRKQVFLDENPELADAMFRLEDHSVLRGTLSAFDLEGDTFRARAGAFEAVFADPQRWIDVTAALLATGDYQRHRPRSWAWQFGTSSPTNETVWRYLLTDGTYEGLASLRGVLGRLLDGVASAKAGMVEHLGEVAASWLAEREEAAVFDWRYLLVKYPSMRSGSTGIYYGDDDQLGYSMCMLRTKILSGFYRDPVLFGVWESSGVGDRVDNPWFRGYANEARWMHLRESRVGIRSVGRGFAIKPPERDGFADAFGDVCDAHNDVHASDDGFLLVIPQADRDGVLVDTVDRIVVGAELINEFVAAGL